jgi:hypothetical protein
MALGGKNIDVSALDTMSTEDIAALDIAHLCEFQDEIDEAETLWETRKEALRFAIEKRIGEKAAAARLAADKDTGTVHVPDGELSIACALTKRVKWDQDKMAAIRVRIINGGGDPDAYIKTALTVPEAIYAEMQPAVQAVFRDARTVTTDKEKFVISDPKAPKAKKSRR